MDPLLDPFSPPFMQRAWLELALLSVPAGVVGALVVLRGLAFPAHALGVGTFPGVALAVGLGVAPFLGGLVAALMLAGLLAVLTRRLDLHPSAVTGILLSAALAVGSLLVSDVYTGRARADALLFGSVIGVDRADLLAAAGVAVLALTALAAFGRPWLATAFDPAHAGVLGARPGRDDAVLLSLLAITVVVAVGAVGSLLVSSLLVVPAATARLVSRRFPTTVLAGTALSLGASTVGLWLAYRTEAPPGATVAATAAGTFVVVAAGRRLMRGARGRGAATAAVAVTVLAAGCGGGDGTPEAGGVGLRVAATTPIVADWVRQVGDGRLQVTPLLDTDADPHAFEPGPREAEAVAEADLLVAVGAGADEWVDDLRAAAGEGLEVVEVAPTAELRRLGDADHEGDADHHEGDADHHEGDTDHDVEDHDVDPHFWHDPRLARRAIDAIADALGRADPAGATAYRTAAARYGEALAALDAELATRYATIPPPKRRLVTNHDAFGYLAARYGLEVVGTVIPSTSTAAEPNAKDTAALIGRIRAQRVPAIFSESTVEPKLARQIAEEAGVTIYADLLGDTLAPAGEPGADYLSMMRRNADTIVAGLSG